MEIKKQSKEFGGFLRQLRKTMGLTLSQLATASGVSKPYIANIENGRRDVPSAEVLIKLSNPLSVDFLLLLEKAGYYKKEEQEDTDPLNFKKDLTYILFRDDINLNSHPLTSEERKKIMNMLEVMFPEKSHKIKKNKVGY
jgi:HTH-type transcriptional regulator, competence development regulator